MMREEVSDRLFAERALSQLPTEALPPRLEAALLAGYESWRAARAKGLLAAIGAGLRSFTQTVWPGAPLGAPAAAFAASLLVGAMIGIWLPAADDSEPQIFSLEHTQNFTLLGADAAQEDL
jgi:hypothetical protein